jgi:copper(I)-binding protein
VIELQIALSPRLSCRPRSGKVSAMKEILPPHASGTLTVLALLASIALAAVRPAPALADPTRASKPTIAPTPKTEPRPTIQVLSAWIRWLPAGLPAAGYLTLINTGNESLALESASSPSYGDVSLHRTVVRAGTEEMMPVKELTLEPHRTLSFEATGYHLMLMRPSTSAETATTIPIDLRFSDGSKLTVPFQVQRQPTGGASP